jgi:hypothetical protein
MLECRASEKLALSQLITADMPMTLANPLKVAESEREKGE